MGTLVKTIPGLQAGWRVELFQQSATHSRDAVVMCERNVPLANQSNFVVWTVNMIEGGCTGGSYFVDYSAAQSEFSRRRMRLS